MGRCCGYRLTLVRLARAPLRLWAHWLRMGEPASPVVTRSRPLAVGVQLHAYMSTCRIC